MLQNVSTLLMGHLQAKVIKRNTKSAFSFKIEVQILQIFVLHVFVINII